MPKAELHVHLEGSIQPDTLLRIAQRNGIALPGDREAELRRGMVYRDFDHFVDLFVTAVRCLRTAEDYEQIVYELGRELARQHVRYAEVTFSPSTSYAYGVPQETYLRGLSHGRQRVRDELGVELGWVFNIVRRWNDAGRLRPMAEYATDVAIAARSEGVVALGLGGAEAGAPPEPFAPWFERARLAGLHSDPHAGEFGGPPSVWGALRALGAERIGHGVRAIEDPALVAYLAERAIPLEISPTSNIRLGVYPDFARHPLRALFQAGVPITVNSDDPPFFTTTLTDELLLLPGVFGFELTEIDDLLLNGVRHSFLPAERKAALLAEFTAELDQLKREHLASSST